MREINIAFTITHDWFKYTAITALSILCNADESDLYNFYVISNEITEADKDSLRILNKVKNANWNFIKVDDDDFKDITHNWLGCVSCYRLKLPELINADKLLYLDSDLIVLKNIAELYDYDISDYYLAAVEDKLFEIRYVVKLRGGETYCNGGVQLINLKKFREDNMVQKIVDKLLEKGNNYTDQDVINDLCREYILSLPLKYNIARDAKGYKYRREEYMQAISDPVILHFTPYKPWSGPEYCEDCEVWHKYEDMYIQLKADVKSS